MVQKIKCVLFGQCGGCSYQDIPYEEELRIKYIHLRSILKDIVDFKKVILEDVVSSPRVYNYRHRLDLRLKRIRNGDIFIGFTPKHHKGVIEVNSCPIAMESLSAFIPQLKKEVPAKLTNKYKQANLVVRTGDDGRVFWGGIGRRSLQLEEKDYLWTAIRGRKIFFSLDTFFQANLSILPLLFDKIIDLGIFNKETYFYDLYGGVGLLSLGFIDNIQKAVLVESSKQSIRLAQYNKNYHKLNNFDLIEGEVEEVLPKLLRESSQDRHCVGMIDPPRAGLSESSRNFISQCTYFSCMLYLSCNPTALAVDLELFLKEGWHLERIIPFDFFPRTKHLESLVVMKRKENFKL